MEIDLPRMQSLSPHFDATADGRDCPSITDLGLTDVSSYMIEPEIEPVPDPSNSSMDDAKSCDWNSDICGCKPGCGCKYINKVSAINSNYVFLIQGITTFVIIVLNWWVAQNNREIRIDSLFRFVCHNVTIRRRTQHVVVLSPINLFFRLTVIYGGFCYVLEL